MSEKRNGEKRQKITWDEATIAEHDKERGSRQKIEEAPTPYRYGSESDQSECESSDAESLHSNKSDNEHGTKNVRFNPKNMVHDSWEAINAKLQYEKYLQEMQDFNQQNSKRNYLNSSVSEKPDLKQLNQTLNQNHEFNESPGGSVKFREKEKNGLAEVQTDFGELIDDHTGSADPNTINPDATSIFNFNMQGNSFSVGGKSPVQSPNKGLKHSRSSNTNNSKTHSGSSSPTIKNQNLKKVKPKAVMIKTSPVPSNRKNNFEFSDGMNLCRSGDSYDGETEQGKISGNGNMFAGINGNLGGDSEVPGSNHRKEQFKNKRAGHYNEFKVLQAMRKKIQEEEEEDDV